MSAGHRRAGQQIGHAHIGRDESLNDTTSACFLRSLCCSSKHFAYIHRNEIALVEQRLVALGNEKAETTKVVYAEKEPINQVEFLKFAGLGEVIVAVNQGGGVFVSETRAWTHAVGAGCTIVHRS